MLESMDFLRESSTVAIDHSSEVLDLIEVRSQISGAFAVRGQWVAQSVLVPPTTSSNSACTASRSLTPGASCLLPR